MRTSRYTLSPETHLSPFSAVQTRGMFLTFAAYLLSHELAPQFWARRFADRIDTVGPRLVSTTRLPQLTRPASTDTHLNLPCLFDTPVSSTQLLCSFPYPSHPQRQR